MDPTSGSRSIGPAREAYEPDSAVLVLRTRLGLLLGVISLREKFGRSPSGCLQFLTRRDVDGS